MKVKLLHVKTNVDTNFYNYGDDREDIIRHIVTDYSDFEECDNLHALDQFVLEFNLKNGKKGEYYLIAYEEKPISVKNAVDKIIEEEKKRQKIALEKEEAQKKRLEEEKALKDVKKRERLEKQLKNLQKKLEENKNK